MTTPAELRALADKLSGEDEAGCWHLRDECEGALRSAADRIEELTKALEQAKREENEACAKRLDEMALEYDRTAQDRTAQHQKLVGGEVPI